MQHCHSTILSCHPQWLIKHNTTMSKVISNILRPIDHVMIMWWYRKVSEPYFCISTLLQGCLFLTVQHKRRIRRRTNKRKKKRGRGTRPWGNRLCTHCMVLRYTFDPCREIASDRQCRKARAALIRASYPKQTKTNNFFVVIRSNKGFLCNYVLKTYL